MKRPPRSLDEVRGLRAARWIRESTGGQFDRYGPGSQREQQDRFIERHGLVDTGLLWQVAESGKTVWRSRPMAAMLAAAQAGEFDLLLAGYSDRWQRNLRRTLELLEDHLHPAGVALVMCDRKILSSDPHDWDELVAESTASERYSRRLSERISDGYREKWESQRDQAGSAGLGFRRSSEPPHRLEIDPDQIGRAVALFERYALGTVSIARLGEETGLEPERIQKILRNPIYSGWLRRHRGTDEQRCPAPWRSNPPVSDTLFSAVEAVRRSKARGGGPRNRGRVDYLAGLIECVCGRRIRSDGPLGTSLVRAKLHTDPCAAWGRRARLASTTWEIPVMAQVGSLRLDDGLIARVVAALESRRPPVSIDKARLERQLRDLALEHATGTLSDEAYLARHGGLKQDLASVTDSPRGVTPSRAVEWLRAFGEAWARADVPEAKADVLHAIYERIVVAGPRIISVRLTRAALSHGLALALPEAVMASPAGFEPATFRLEGGCSVH